MSRLGWLTAALVALASASSFALEPGAVPAEKRTQANLYLSAAETPAFLQSKNGRALFLDVRTPEELVSVGSTPLIDANVPVKIVTPDGAELNPDFAASVDGRLASKGLSKSDPVVLMCRSGHRSVVAAGILAAAGYTQVYSVVDGFEGDGSNGWKKSGLAWGYAIDKAKMPAN
jgi:rhodanese-related sulfurtransferase